MIEEPQKNTRIIEKKFHRPYSKKFDKMNFPLQIISPYKIWNFNKYEIPHTN
jgi:hypothetical protein